MLSYISISACMHVYAPCMKLKIAAIHVGPWCYAPKWNSRNLGSRHLLGWGDECRDLVRFRPLQHLRMKKQNPHKSPSSYGILWDFMGFMVIKWDMNGIYPLVT